MAKKIKMELFSTRKICDKIERSGPQSKDPVYSDAKTWFIQNGIQGESHWRTGYGT
jgi:hypothetical protein